MLVTFTHTGAVANPDTQRIDNQAQNAPSDPLVADAAKARVALKRYSAGSQSDELNDAVKLAISKAELATARLDSAGTLEAFQPLTRYAALDSFPSIRVQGLLAAARRAAGDDVAAANHERLARALLFGLIRGGSTSDTPISIAHRFEMGDLLAALNARVISNRVVTTSTNRQIHALALEVRGQPQRTLYFDLTDAIPVRLGDRFKRLDIERLPSDMQMAIEDARTLLQRFFADSTLPYQQLAHAIKESIKAADRHLEQGRRAEAKLALEKVGEIRPIADIPHLGLQTRLSYLQGLLGDLAAQKASRLRIFGLQQAVAESGDGMSLETAVEVPFVDLEYDWLADHGLTRKQQHLKHVGEKSYDVLEVTEGDGTTGQRFFNITRLFAMYRLTPGAR